MAKEKTPTTEKNSAHPPLLPKAVALASGRVEVGSRVTLEQDYAFHGKVFSRRDACERNRTVAVYQVRPGADGLYDATRSNAEGRWEVLAGAPNGEFYAVARVRSIDKGTTTLAARGRNLRWPRSERDHSDIGLAVGCWRASRGGSGAPAHCCSRDDPEARARMSSMTPVLASA